MPKLTFEIPTDIKDIIKRHERLTGTSCHKAIWNYARKIKLLESVTAKADSQKVMLMLTI